jgi:hypothetical protein
MSRLLLNYSPYARLVATFFSTAFKCAPSARQGLTARASCAEQARATRGVNRAAGMTGRGRAEGAEGLAVAGWQLRSRPSGRHGSGGVPQPAGDGQLRASEVPPAQRVRGVPTCL